MGRRRTVAAFKKLPLRMHLKGETYYHVGSGSPRVWTKLGREWAIAIRLYAEIEGTQYPENDATFKAIAARYRREILPRKAPQTQRDNAKELQNLEAVFGDVPIDKIKPHHVRKYLDTRGLKAKVRANREKALLSHVFNCAREWGYTDAPNPCAGVKGFRETGRDRYVEDDEFRAVYEKAHFTVQDAMDLAYLTGQRPADVLKLQRADVRDGALWITQGKTGKKLRIEVTGELARVVERIQSRPRRALGLSLIQDENGQRVSYTSLRSRFDKARELAGVSFQFRDIRAKAATDAGDLHYAQKLLGHKRQAMTEHYTRNRRGERLKPLK